MNKKIICTNRPLLILLLAVCLFFPLKTFGSAENEQLITLSLPQPVLAQAVDKMVPLNVDVSSTTFNGSVSIISVNDILLENQQISCRLGLIGKDLRLVSEIAGHKINLNVGAVKLNVNANARIRFDSHKQMLYIRPVLSRKPNEKVQKDDIANALLAFISGRDFPVAIKKLKPLIADTNNKSIIIDMEIRNIEAVNNALKISITPSVSNITSKVSQIQ